MDIQPPKTSQPSIFMIQRLSIPKRKQRNKQEKQHSFPFLARPLELRILVYNHAMSGQEHNITKRHHGYRLLGLFHTHPQSRMRYTGSATLPPFLMLQYRHYARSNHSSTQSLRHSIQIVYGQQSSERVSQSRERKTWNYESKDQVFGLQEEAV